MADPPHGKLYASTYHGQNESISSKRLFITSHLKTIILVKILGMQIFLEPVGHWGRTRIKLGQVFVLRWKCRVKQCLPSALPQAWHAK